MPWSITLSANARGCVAPHRVRSALHPEWWRSTRRVVRCTARRARKAAASQTPRRSPGRQHTGDPAVEVSQGDVVMLRVPEPTHSRAITTSRSVQGRTNRVFAAQTGWSPGRRAEEARRDLLHVGLARAGVILESIEPGSAIEDEHHSLHAVDVPRRPTEDVRDLLERVLVHRAGSRLLLEAVLRSGARERPFRGNVDGTAPQRTAAWLLENAPRAGQVTRRVLAGLLGMWPETLSRALRQLASQGAIRHTRRVMEIVDRGQLRSVVRRGRGPGDRDVD